MKKLLITIGLIVLLLPSGLFGADAKITALTEDTTPTSDDLVKTVNAPGSSPADRKSTLGNLIKWFFVPGGSTNVTTITGNYAFGVTLTGATAVTMPTSGTLATTAGTLASTALDDTKGNGDTTFVWSADKVYDQLALKANASRFSFAGANNVLTYTGDYSLGITLTGNTGVTLPTSGTLAVVGGALGTPSFTALNLPSSNADPGTTAGQIRHDSTITGMTRGGVTWYDGTGVRLLVDLDTVPGDAQDDYVLAYDKDADKFYMKADNTGEAGSGDITSVWSDDTGDVSALTAASGDTFDASLADSSNPFKTGNTAGVPGTCTAGQTYHDTQAKVLYLCTAANTWTQVVAVGADGTYGGIFKQNTSAIEDPAAGSMTFGFIGEDLWTKSPGDTALKVLKTNDLGTNVGTALAGALDTDLSSVSGSDDTIASAKAVKAMGDLKAPIADPQFTGVVDIPTDATTNAAGEITIDLTTDQWRYYGGAERVIPYLKTFSVVVPAVADTDDMFIMKAPYGMTMLALNCIVSAATSATINIQECGADGTSCTDTATSDLACDADGANTSTFNNAVIDSGDWIKLDVASISGTPGTLSVTVTYSVVAD